MTVRVGDGVVTGQALVAKVVVTRRGAGTTTVSASTTGVAGPAVRPSVPLNVNIVVGSGNIAYIRWDAPASFGSSYITHYVIQRATSSAGPWTTITQMPAHSWSSYQFGDSRAAGQHFYYRVAAVNTGGTGRVSAPIPA